MPGFYISNCCAASFGHADHRIEEEAVLANQFISRSTLDKFADDKCFYEDERYFLILEGVLLNKTELFDAYGCKGIPELLIAMLERDDEDFFVAFRGSFSGAVYDKVQHGWTIFTNHYGDNAVFYYVDEQGRFIISSELDSILRGMKSLNAPITIDEQAFYSMLTYGYMVDDSTYATSIKRLLPGCYLKIASNGSLSTHRYYMPKADSCELSQATEKELLDELDRRFRVAVSREFEKDAEYGYRLLADLSGGLDSRMTTWVASDLGYGPALNITYCQAGYLDEVIAEEIAADLGNEFLFKSLDDASFIFDAKRIVARNYGLGLYTGISGGESLLRALDMMSFGIEHTGQIGDVIIGSFLSSPAERQVIDHAQMYSATLADKVPTIDFSQWSDREQYLFSIRAFLGTLSSHFLRRQYTEVASPFLDVDFLDFCLSIPEEKRIGHRLYKRWIAEYYPGAAGYRWEKTGLPVLASDGSIFMERAKRKVGRVLSKKDDGHYGGMTPFDLWAKKNPKIGEWMDGIFVDASAGVPVELLADAEHLFRTGNTLEKSQVLTALLAVDYYKGYGSYSF